MIVGTFETLIFSGRSIALTNIDYMPQICLLCKLNYPSIDSMSEEREGS